MADDDTDAIPDERPALYDLNAARKTDFVQRIEVTAPRHGSDIRGDIVVVFRAPGMTRVQTRCWHGPTPEKPGTFGHDAVLADLALGPDGVGRFVFHADEFPHGPLTIRLQAKDDGDLKDYFEIQLFNVGGVAWREGLPDTAPPAAAGMRLVFAEDFDGPLSISSNGLGARYAAHKTSGSEQNQDFSDWPFTDPGGENQPFGQRGTWLRIHASKPDGMRGRTGLLASIRPDGTGVCVPVPSYFECRFIAHSAHGTWPAFWTLTRGTKGMGRNDPDYEAVAAMVTDELDVVECYGGYGPGNPNHGGRYEVTTHFWGQDAPNVHRFLNACEIGGGAAWSWTPHDYGVAITETDTVYYLDGCEVFRHPTGPVLIAQPAWFLIDYAIGGASGWPVDLERYGNQSDMWVDWIRVYSK